MINIAELLKDAPEGTELWFTLYGKVKFMSVNFYETYPIQIRLNDNTVEKLDKYGRFFDHYEDAECVLFPSKDCRTWEGWKAPIESNFKVGDWVVFNNSHNSIYQISEISDSYYTLTHTHCGSMSLSFSQEKLIRPWTIEDAKDGDILYSPCCKLLWIYKDDNSCYIGNNLNYNEDSVVINSPICIPIDVVPATNEQCDLLFHKIKENGYEWDADKKELRKIQPHYDITNFHAGMPVLVRNSNDSKWYLSYYGFYDATMTVPFKFICINGESWKQCIPSNDDTEHLLGTTEPCGEEYINW